MSVLERMRSAAAYLCTSIWGEPFSNTVIEALGVGTPLIGSLTDSYLEVVQPEVHGLGYPKDRPDALAACMRRILQDPELGRRLATNGLALARDHYSMPQILDQTERLLAQVVDLHARDRSTALAGRVGG